MAAARRTAPPSPQWQRRSPIASGVAFAVPPPATLAATAPRSVTPARSARQRPWPPPHPRALAPGPCTPFPDTPAHVAATASARRQTPRALIRRHAPEFDATPRPAAPAAYRFDF